MKLKFIGKDGSMGLKHGEVYNITIFTENNKLVVRLGPHRYCPYSSPLALASNWTTEEITMRLPTAEEYATMCVPAIYNTQQYSEPKYICPVCGGGMCRDESVICTSNPPKRKYVCDKCGNVDYQYQ